MIKRSWALILAAGGLTLAGCGAPTVKSTAPPSHHHSSPPSGAPTQTVTATVTVTKTVTASPSVDPAKAPVKTSPVPFHITGTPQAGGTLTVVWNPAQNFHWSLQSIDLYSVSLPKQNTLTTEYFRTDSEGNPTIQIPMALEGDRMRFIVQFRSNTGQMVTEYSAVFTIS